MDIRLTRERLLILSAVFAPLGVAAAMVPFRDSFANSDAALVLVLVVVAVAANGRWPAGVLSALSAGIWFDFFLTRPYEQLVINAPADVETTVLLLLVGVGVTELAVWGRRQQAQVSRDAGYLAGIHAAAESVATGESPSVLVTRVCDQLTQLLHLSSCEFDYGTGVVGGRGPRLRHDGQIEWAESVWDVARDGLPVGREVELLAVSPSGYRGTFRLTAAAGSHPTLVQRLVAVALADQVAAALTATATGRG